MPPSNCTRHRLKETRLYIAANRPKAPSRPIFAVSTALATSLTPRRANDWEGRIYGRLSAMPPQAEPLQRAQLLAALSVGTDIIRLRRTAVRFDLQVEIDAALEAIARGESSVAIERLARLDGMLAVLPSTRPGARPMLRARGGILAMSEALAQHAAYFDSGVGR
jgi:hypothetical protein